MTEELNRYVLAHIDKEPIWLSKLDRDANLELMNPRMNSGHLQGRLLKMLVRIARPRHILELGTFGGYSALCMAEGMEDGATLTTVEIDDEKEDFINRHLSESPYGNRVKVMIADVRELLKTYADESFDLIFLDSDKRDYPALYGECKRLLCAGGLLIADNVLWDGHIIDSRYDGDAQTQALRHFNDMVAADTDMEAVILPLRDGLSLIRKKTQILRGS